MYDENYTGEEHVEAAAQPANEDSTTQAVEREEERVPLSALQAERRQRQELQQNLKMMQDHLELLRANQTSSSKPQDDQFSDLQDDDVLTVKEAKKFMESLQHNYQMSIEELKMQQSYPDYAEIVRNYLPEVLKENPELRDDIQRAKNPYKLAYFLAKKSDQYKSDNKQVQKSEKAERILKNSNRAGNLSSVGQTAPQNSTKSWGQMSDSEFLKHVNRHLGYS